MIKKIDGNQNLELNKIIKIVDYGFGNLASVKNAINFNGLKKDGWSYSKINTSKVLYNDDDTSMVQVNFSRLDKDNEIILTSDVTYLLVNKDGNWKLKGGFSPNLTTLGND